MLKNLVASASQVDGLKAKLIKYREKYFHLFELFFKMKLSVCDFFSGLKLKWVDKLLFCYPSLWLIAFVNYT